MTTTPDYAGLEALEQAIIGYWGNRCSDFDGNCPCCQSWKQFDALRTLLESNAALERERDEARRQSDRFCDKYLAALSRAEAAEAERYQLKKRLAELETSVETLRRHALEWEGRAEAAEARVKELEAENACLRERQAEADRVIDMVEEDPALARSLARSYRDKGRE